MCSLLFQGIQGRYAQRRELSRIVDESSLFAQLPDANIGNNNNNRQAQQAVVEERPQQRRNHRAQNSNTQHVLRRFLSGSVRSILGVQTNSSSPDELAGEFDHFRRRDPVTSLFDHDPSISRQGYLILQASMRGGMLL
ncbi:unnamed protein product [Sphagnum balticum]